MSLGESTQPLNQAKPELGNRLWPLTRYFLKLGTLGFGGPAALIGFMHRDLVERRRWIDEDTYKLALALAQIMPGPLAAQTAIAIGYFQAGVLGATTVGLAFVLPSFLMVVGLSMMYVAYGGLWWMQALFYGIGAAVIAIIAIAAYKLARSTNRADPLLWGIFVVLALATAVLQAELAELFLVAGLLTLVIKAPPAWLKGRLPFLGVAPGRSPPRCSRWRRPRRVRVSTCSCRSWSSSPRPGRSSSGAAWRSSRSSTRAWCSSSAG